MGVKQPMRVSAWDDEEKEGFSSSEVGKAASHGSSHSGGGSSEPGDDASEYSDTSDDDEAVDSGQKYEDSISGDDIQPDLADISFGALAKAQESLNTGKRKRAASQDQSRSEVLDDLRAKLRKTTSETKPSKRRSQEDKPHRTSKHAPQVLSSKRPVTRKRVVVSPPPSLKSRDPRFDPTVASNNSTAQNNTDKAYSFLTTYRDTEIAALRAQIKSAKDPHLQHTLKRQLDTLTSKQRQSERKSKEREVVREHRLKEKEAIREGKKATPYYLKKGDLRKEVEKRRLEGMGKRKRDKAEKRRQKRVKGKEMREMPWERRSAATTASS